MNPRTAVFAILVRLQGFKARRAQIDFADGPVTLGNLFDKLERMCGWQLAQRLAGY